MYYTIFSINSKDFFTDLFSQKNFIFTFLFCYATIMRNKIFLHPGLIKEKNMKIKSLIMDESALARTLKRISHEIIERNEV